MKKITYFFWFEITTIYNTQLDYIWTNVLTQQCDFESIEAYCIHHKPIYFAFKLPNYVAKFDIPKNSTSLYFMYICTYGCVRIVKYNTFKQTIHLII
jgi:hypothetical protein